MASLCPKCLGELQPGATICSNCGAEQGATRATGSGPVNAPGDPDSAAPLLLPAVVPPPPGAGAFGQGGQRPSPKPAAGLESPGYATAGSPPAFGPPPVFGQPPAAAAAASAAGSQLDPGSPASLLGPSAHSAPAGHETPLHLHETPPHIPPQIPPQTTPHTQEPPTDERPVNTGAPTAQDLIFGSPPPSAGPPTTGPFRGSPPPPPASPFPGASETQNQFLLRAPLAMLPGDPRRARVLAKLRRRSTLLPMAAAVVVVAVVASVLAVGSGSPSRNAAGTNTTGTHTAANAAKKSVTLSHKDTTVNVALRSPSDDPRPDITVRVGNDPDPLHVVLDTGSVGLRVFSNLLPTGRGKGIDVTAHQDSVEYVDGTQFSGPVADALVHIGSLTTTRTVAFQLVTSVTCDPQIPDCPAFGGASQFESDDVDGIMGIGLGGAYQDDPTTNPLLSLKAPYRNSWSIQMSGGGTNLPAPGTLVLGAQDPTAPTAQFSLQQQQGATVAGSPTWNDQFNLCWDIGGLSNCELTVFDSGSDLTVLSGSGFASVPTDAPGEISTLTTGTSVQCSQEIDGNPLWSFNAGGGSMQTVFVEPGGSDWVNSGVQAFYSFTVTYDEANGQIFLS